MTISEFEIMCEHYLISPDVALENENLVAAWKRAIDSARAAIAKAKGGQ